MPKVSVLMPIYRTKPQFLRETIESILNQTYTDFEFLILDDCPEDNREKIVKSYSDKRIHYLKNKKNLGITPSRNKLLKMAKGKYLAIMDHDDISLANRFQEQVSFLESHPSVGVCGNWYQQIPSGRIFRLPESHKMIELSLLQDCFILHPTSMLRKSVLDKNKIKYEESFSPSEDYRLWTALIGKTKFYNIPKVLFQYRVHETNTSKIQSDKMKDCHTHIAEQVRREHPALWAEFCKVMPHVVRVKLFDKIQLFKFSQKGNQENKFLKYCPFLTQKIKLKGY